MVEKEFDLEENKREFYKISARIELTLKSMKEHSEKFFKDMKEGLDSMTRML